MIFSAQAHDPEHNVSEVKQTLHESKSNALLTAHLWKEHEEKCVPSVSQFPRLWNFSQDFCTEQTRHVTEKTLGSSLVVRQLLFASIHSPVLASQTTAGTNKNQEMTHISPPLHWHMLYVTIKLGTQYTTKNILIRMHSVTPILSVPQLWFNLFSVGSFRAIIHHIAYWIAWFTVHRRVTFALLHMRRSSGVVTQNIRGFFGFCFFYCCWGFVFLSPWLMNVVLVFRQWVIGKGFTENRHEIAHLLVVNTSSQLNRVNSTDWDEKQISWFKSLLSSS